MTRVTGHWLHDPETALVTDALERAGKKALFVGGCVRNALLGAPVSDIDISTDALPEEVIRIAEVAGLRALPTGIDHGTVTVIAKHVPHEVTTFRKDVETDGRRAVVAYSTRLEDDAHRRDFTMNALYADSSGQVIDPVGGLADLEARRVRFIDDPDLRIREDYLRILRFFRFHAHYGKPDAGMDPDALAAIAQNLDGLEKLSRERVGAEMRKLLAAPDPSGAVAAMKACGALARLLPGADNVALAPLVHLEGLCGLSPDPIRRLAALGGADVARVLRLSKADTKHRQALIDALSSGETAMALGYRIGADWAVDAVLLRSAMTSQPVDPAELEQAGDGAGQVFPLKAADIPALSGPSLGAKLKELEARWIASGFSLSKAQLLAE